MTSALFRKSISQGLFAHHRMRLLVLLTTVCVIAAGSFTFAADAPGDSYIKYSTNTNRTGSVALNGATVRGNIYVHLSDNTINSAMFFLDTNGNLANSVSLTSMKTYPFDLQYRFSDGTARPLDTKALKDGQHTLVVRVRNTKTSKYTTHTSLFTVNNTVATTTTTTTTTKPTTTTTTTTTKPTTTTTTTRPYAFVPAFAGDVAPGRVRWGAGISEDPIGVITPEARHGAELGGRLGLHRRFFGWDMKGPVTQARTDIAAGRLPWVSIKPAGSWKSVGDGAYDAQLKQLFTDLGKLDGPVWFTFNHEPEGGASQPGPDDPGGAPEYIRMQERTSKVLRELRAQGIANNVSFASILMGWTWDTRSGRTPSDWFKPGIWDFAGIDAYAEDEGLKPMIETNALDKARLFYGERGLKIAIGEFGIRNQKHQETTAGEIPDATEQLNAATRLENYYNEILKSATDGKGSQIIGAAYFDSNYNSPNGGWQLRYLQLPKWRELAVLPTSVTLD